MAVELTASACLANGLSRAQEPVIISLDSLSEEVLQDTWHLARKQNSSSVADRQPYTTIDSEDTHNSNPPAFVRDRSQTKSMTTRYELEQTGFADLKRSELSAIQMELRVELAELQLVQNIRAMCAQMQRELQRDDLLAAFSSLKAIGNLMKSGIPAQAQGHLRSDYSNIQNALKCELETIAQSWWQRLVFCSQDFIQIDGSDRLLTVVQILEFTNALIPNIEHFFCRTISYLFSKVLLNYKSVIANQDKLLIDTECGSSGLEAFQIGVDFILKRLPGASTPLVRSYLVPLLLELLRTEYIPIHLTPTNSVSDQVRIMQTTLTNFQQFLSKLSLLSQDEDVDLLWKQCVDMWCTRRRNSAMSSIRHAVLSWQGFTKAVQIQGDSPISSSDQPRSAMMKLEVPSNIEKEVHENEQDDWGNDDWGMSDIDDIPEAPLRGPTSPLSGPPNVSGDLVEAEKICIDSYTISSIPDAVVQIAESYRDDMNTLKPYIYEHTIQVASTDDHAFEEDLLDIYSMLACILIRQRGYPRLLVYNDCVHLANRFPSLQKLTILGGIYYAEEIAEKRQQVIGLMEQCQGFMASTAPSQQSHCYDAIQEVTQLLLRLHERYEYFLTQNAMFTALGTLADAAIRYMTDSIMAMTDISEAESTELAKMGDLLSLVERVFERPHDPIPLAGMWCTSWFKFRYVLDILEANIDYILELWHENALSDFTSNEIKHLLTALFSDSQRRRSAIEQIDSTIV